MNSALNEQVQRAAAFVAARSRGDHQAAESLLESLGTDAQRAVAFMSLADLSLRLLSESDGQDVDVVASHLALSIAQACDQT